MVTAKAAPKIEEFAAEGFTHVECIARAVRDGDKGGLAKIAISSGLGLRVRRPTVFEKANFDLVNDVF